MRKEAFPLKHLIILLVFTLIILVSLYYFPSGKQGFVVQQIPSPDLTVQRLSLASNGNVVYVLVKNIGSALSPSCQLDLTWASDFCPSPSVAVGTNKCKWTYTVPVLDAGQNITIEAQGPVGLGYFQGKTVTATIDSANQVYETNETNNQLTKTLVACSITNKICHDTEGYHYPYCIGNNAIGSYYCNSQGVCTPSLFAVSCPQGQVCVQSPNGALCVSQVRINCTETDNGNNIFVKGNCTDSSGIHQDECRTERVCILGQCVNITYLYEYNCVNNTCQLNKTRCPAGTSCIDGACKAVVGCNDPDGNNTFVKGSCTDASGIHQDECRTERVCTMWMVDGAPQCVRWANITYLYEYNCVNNTCQLNKTRCPAGTSCIDGACKAVVGCNDPDGNNTFVKGNCTDSSGIHEDVCAPFGNTSYVIEQKCENGTCINTTLICPENYSCYEGRCVNNSCLLAGGGCYLQCPQDKPREDATKSCGNNYKCCMPALPFSVDLIEPANNTYFNQSVEINFSWVPRNFPVSAYCGIVVFNSSLDLIFYHSQSCPTDQLCSWKAPQLNESDQYMWAVACAENETEFENNSVWSEIRTFEIEITYHRICWNQQCIPVTGPGTDECQNDIDCAGVAACSESWTNVSDWEPAECPPEGKQYKLWYDQNQCGTNQTKACLLQLEQGYWYCIEERTCQYQLAGQTLNCTEWAPYPCQANQVQQRICSYSNGTAFAESRPCCMPNWTVVRWSECVADTGLEYAQYQDANNCGTLFGKPGTPQAPVIETRPCKAKWPKWLKWALLAALFLMILVIAILAARKKALTRARIRLSEKEKPKPTYPELRAFIDKALKAGMSKAEIREALLEKGWPKELVEKELE